MLLPEVFFYFDDCGDYPLCERDKYYLISGDKVDKYGFTKLTFEDFKLKYF